jgi:hypothetical protein
LLVCARRACSGLFRDSLSGICLELQSPHSHLFVPCPNARAGVGITLDKWLPRRSCASSEVFLSLYRFVGVLMGVAIRTGNPLDLNLPSLVWKPIVGQTLKEGDVKAVDELCITAMDAIVDDNGLAAKGVTADNFEDTYGFTFTYAASDSTVVELKEGGADIPVTYDAPHPLPLARAVLCICWYLALIQCVVVGVVCCSAVRVVVQLVVPFRVRASGEAVPTARIGRAGGGHPRGSVLNHSVAFPVATDVEGARDRGVRLADHRH